MKYFFWLFLVLLVPGCSQPSEFRAISEYRAKHAQEAKLFVQIYPVNLTLFREMLGGRALSVDLLARGLKQKFEKVPGLKDFVEQKQREDQDEIDKQYKEYHELERLSENGGLICEYEWNDKKILEVGLLVLKDGNIIRRDEGYQRNVDPEFLKGVLEDVKAIDERSKQK